VDPKYDGSKTFKASKSSRHYCHLFIIFEKLINYSGKPGFPKINVISVYHTFNQTIIANQQGKTSMDKATEDFKATIDKLNKELEIERNKNVELTKEIKIKDDKIDKLQATIDKLVNKTDQVLEQNNELLEAKDRVEADLNTITGQLDTSNSKLNSVSNKLDTMHENINKLTNSTVKSDSSKYSLRLYIDINKSTNASSDKVWICSNNGLKSNFIHNHADKKIEEGMVKLKSKKLNRIPYNCLKDNTIYILRDLPSVNKEKYNELLNNVMLSSLIQNVVNSHVLIKKSDVGNFLDIIEELLTEPTQTELIQTVEDMKLTIQTDKYSNEEESYKKKLLERFDNIHFTNGSQRKFIYCDIDGIQKKVNEIDIEIAITLDWYYLTKAGRNYKRNPITSSNLKSFSSFSNINGKCGY
jgi:hypothetical protein